MKTRALTQPSLLAAGGAGRARSFNDLARIGGIGGRGAVTAPLALATILAPLCFVLLCEAAGLHALGYTRSLVLFLVPATVGVAWLFDQHRSHLSVRWRVLAQTVGLWTGIGWLLDLALAASFFRFPDPSTVCGLTLPGFDLASGGLTAVPVEEFVFYLLGFIVAVVLYLWFDCRSGSIAHPEAVRQALPATSRVHMPTLAIGGLALVAAWLSKGRLPGYALFLVVAGVFPNAWLLPIAWTRVNKSALVSAMAVLFVLAAIWEAGLALPNGWWAYNERHMTAFVETPWSRLPIEAIAVWLLWPFTTIITYEALRAACEQTQRRASAVQPNTGYEAKPH